jgi:hypothetical protein
MRQAEYDARSIWFWALLEALSRSKSRSGLNMAQLRIMAALVIQRSHISHHRVTRGLMRSHFLWMVKAYTEAASQPFVFPWTSNSGIGCGGPQKPIYKAAVRWAALVNRAAALQLAASTQPQSARRRASRGSWGTWGCPGPLAIIPLIPRYTNRNSLTCWYSSSGRSTQSVKCRRLGESGKACGSRARPACAP